MNPHLCPKSAFAFPGIRDLTQQRDHLEFFEGDGVEGDLIDPIEDLPGRRGVPGRSIGLMGTRIVSRELHSSTNGMMLGLPE